MLPMDGYTMSALSELPTEITWVWSNREILDMEEQEDNI